MAKSGDGERAPTSGDAPTSSAAVRPKLPPPPEVGPGDAPRERTVVTRAPPRATGPSDPKELLPTLRMPPAEARAVRREAEDLAARLGIGGGAKRGAKPDAGANGSASGSGSASQSAGASGSASASPSVPASVEAPSEAPELREASPVVTSDVAKQADEVTRRSAPPIDPRELVPTMQLPAVAPLPEHRERSAHPQARRPPLPLPSVLRSGPRTMAGQRMPPPADTTATPSERSAPRFGTPEPMPVIDTATLVADVAEQLYEAEAAEEAARVAEAAAARAAEAATSDPDDRDAPAILEQVHPAPKPAIPRIPTMVAEPIDDAIASDDPPRKLGWIAAVAAAFVATIGLASYGWSSDAKEVEPAARTEAALSSSASNEPSRAALPTKPPTTAPALAMAPTPPPVPAVDPPPIDPIDPIDPPVVEPVAPAPAVATPLSEAVPPPPTPALEIEDDEAPVAAPASTPAPAPAAAPKKPSPPPKHSKSSKRASKSAPKKSPSSPPPPAAAKQASSAPAASTTGKQDAASLLKEAEAAYGKGSWGSALRSAQKSNGMRSDARALKIIALAACRLGKQSTAQNAFDRLPLGMRKSVRTTCRDVGIRLQL